MDLVSHFVDSEKHSDVKVQLDPWMMVNGLTFIKVWKKQGAG